MKIIAVFLVFLMTLASARVFSQVNEQVTKNKVCNSANGVFIQCSPGYICGPHDVCVTLNDLQVEIAKDKYKRADTSGNIKLAEETTDLMPRGLPYCASTGPRVDGRCGCNYEGATCNPSGPFGGCCSSDGYCTPCSRLARPPPEPKRGADTTLKTSTTTASTTTTEPPPAGSLINNPYTVDGTCGAYHGGTTCGGWADGNFCSAEGLCGSGEAFCGLGCQSGGCY